MYVVNYENYSIHKKPDEPDFAIEYHAKKNQEYYDTFAEALNGLLFYHETERKLFEWKEKRIVMLTELADAMQHDESYKKS